MLFDHPGDERTPEIMRHDLHAHLFAALTGDVVDRVLGNAFARDMAAATDTIEQEAIVLFAFLEVRAAKLQPGLQLGKRPGRRVLDQFLVALADHAHAAFVEVDLRQVEVDRLRLAHARAIQQADHRRIPQALGARVGGADFHHFADQCAAQVTALPQTGAGRGLDRAHLQQVVLADQAQAPRLVHYPAYRVHIQRRRVRRIAVLTQRGDQGNHLFRLQQVPVDLVEVDVFKTQPVGRVLQHVAHGQLAGRGQTGEVEGQRVADGLCQGRSAFGLNTSTKPLFNRGI